MNDKNISATSSVTDIRGAEEIFQMKLSSAYLPYVLAYHNTIQFFPDFIRKKRGGEEIIPFSLTCPPNGGLFQMDSNSVYRTHHGQWDMGPSNMVHVQHLAKIKIKSALNINLMKHVVAWFSKCLRLCVCTSCLLTSN